MSARVRIGQGTDGGLVAIKSAADQEQAAALAREKAVLAALDHPGVVRLHPGAATGPWELATAWVGPRSLADGPAPTPATAGAVVAVAADVVADLHQAGTAHLRLDASHVLIDPAGRPVLTGLAGAAAVGSPSPTGRPSRPSTDVADLGSLLAELLERSSPRPRPPQLIPRWGGRRADDRLRAALAGLAAQATAADPAARPPARAWARAVRQAVEAHGGAVPAPWGAPPAPQAPAEGGGDPLARLHALADAHRLSLDPPRPTSAALVVGAAGVVALVGLAALVAVTASALLGPGPSGAASTTTDPTAAASTTSTATASTTTASTTTGGPAPEVSLGQRRFRVGQPGDEAAVADWRCDGSPTVALVRPATGAVFLFDRWADPGTQLTRPPTARAAPGSRLVPPAPDDPCPALVVAPPGGGTRPLPVPRGTP